MLDERQIADGGFMDESKMRQVIAETKANSYAAPTLHGIWMPCSLQPPSRWQEVSPL
jgi:hypothetical protein